LRLLVTGCGRSGTHTVAAALVAAGIDARHEPGMRPFHNGRGNWPAEVSWRVAPYTPWPGAHVVHLVRHPLDVIRSRVDRGNFEKTYWPAKLARRWCPGMALGADPVERVAWHWVQWNRLVVADERLRIEDLTPEAINRLARLVDPSAPGIEALPERQSPTPAETRSDDLGWERVEHVPGLVALAEQYGYR
jgi:hypothetical protein